MILELARSRMPAVLADIRALVECESPSDDLAALERCADLLDSIGARELGSRAERLPSGDRVHLRWRLGEGPRSVLLLGHLDTVWPIGSLETHPWSTVDGILRGPGCFDMKTGIVQILAAIGLLRKEFGDQSVAGVTVLVTSDEEIGSPTSRELIEDEARAHPACLVTEAAAPGGRLKLARKGASTYRLQAIGRAAHAGLDPERGVNAAVEIAHQIIRIAALGDSDAGTTVTPTVLDGGSATNTVPAEAGVAVDVRAATVAEQDRIDGILRTLTPVLPGARLDLSGGPNRPPMEAALSVELLAVAQRVARDLGLPELEGVAVGGASDGNLTAGVGTPTLDGLGAVGGGAHAADEHVVIGEIPSRIALLARLIRALTPNGSDHAH